MRLNVMLTRDGAFSDEVSFDPCQTSVSCLAGACVFDPCQTFVSCLAGVCVFDPCQTFVSCLAGACVFTLVRPRLPCSRLQK